MWKFYLRLFFCLFDGFPWMNFDLRFSFSALDFLVEFCESVCVFHS